VAPCVEKNVVVITCDSNHITVFRCQIRYIHTRTCIHTCINFLSKLICTWLVCTYHRKNIQKICPTFVILKQLPKVKQTPNRRKFAQSGHPMCISTLLPIFYIRDVHHISQFTRSSASTTPSQTGWLGWANFNLHIGRIFT
jgi:hypothetical protein